MSDSNSTNSANNSSLAPLPRKFQVQPILIDSSPDVSERLLAYFPGLNNGSTPRSTGSVSNAGTPTAASATISPRASLLHRVRSTSPTDFREDTVTDPHLLLRKKLKMPMQMEQAKAVRAKFMTFDSGDLQEQQSLSLQERAIDLPKIPFLQDSERADSLTSIDTYQTVDDDNKSSSNNNSPHTSINRQQFNASFKQDMDSPIATDANSSWQIKRSFYNSRSQNAQEELLAPSKDEYDVDHHRIDSKNSRGDKNDSK